MEFNIYHTNDIHSNFDFLRRVPDELAVFDKWFIRDMAAQDLTDEELFRTAALPRCQM